MAIEVKFRRGTTAQHSSFTGANGEITVDTTLQTLIVHDGVTAGGTRIAKYSDLGAAANLEAISSNLIPSANVTYDLGTTEKRWRDLYLSGTTINLGNTAISANVTTGSLEIVRSGQSKQYLSLSTLPPSSDTTVTNLNTANVASLILQSALGTQYGGTGLTSFTNAGVLYASNTTALSFATGSSGDTLQINDSGVPVFDVLDGGTF